MDRCHRIGQTKPVLVIRLATMHSVEGKMLRRANEKLMLERLVIKKGAFLDASTAEVRTEGRGRALCAVQAAPGRGPIARPHPPTLTCLRCTLVCRRPPLRGAAGAAAA